MKVRKLKARIVGMMDTYTHGFMHGVNRRDPKWMNRCTTDKMHFSRKLKPCATYSPWCSDCNAVAFRIINGRFPYGYEEFFAFEDAAQNGEKA